MATKKFRKMVSLKKKRFTEDGFDLDLAYITPRIVAFGYPAEGREAVYRNPMDQVRRFFDHYHKDKYYIYNLCIEPERQYKAKNFYGRVGKYQFYDHNAPPLQLIPEFCKHAEEWLNKDPENVIGVHCKAGKGRTGVMICCLMLHMRQYTDAEEAMKFYGEQRTYNGHGVTIPSQRRFIGYYAKQLLEGERPWGSVFVEGLILNNIGTLKDQKINFIIECNGNRVYDSKKREVMVWPGDESIVIDSERPIPVCGNVKVILYKSSSEILCWFWFHSAYIEQTTLVLTKKQIDKAVGDKQHKIYPVDFSVTCKFANEGLVKDNTRKVGKSEENLNAIAADSAPKDSTTASVAPVAALKPDEESEDEPLEDGEDEDNEDEDEEEEEENEQPDAPEFSSPAPNPSSSTDPPAATTPATPTTPTAESQQRSRGDTDSTPKKKGSVLSRLLH